MSKYLKQYKLPLIKEMVENCKKKPVECTDDFKGKLVAITGGTSGIGYLTAKEYAKHGADLLIVGRNKEKTEGVCREISYEFGVNCDHRIADFAHLSQVHALADELIKSDLKFDVFIHNAGIYMTKRTFSEDDIELVFQVNYLASFILNYRLMDHFKSQGKKLRIIYVNSEGHRFAITGIHLKDLRWKWHIYTGLKSYGSAKTAQLLSMLKFRDEFQGTNVTVNAMHPGNVVTNIGENNGFFYRLYKHHYINRIADPADISATALYYLGVSKEIEGVSGEFFNLTTKEVPAPPALDEEVANKLWEISKEMGGLK